MAEEKHILIVGNGIAAMMAALSAREETQSPITLIGGAAGASRHFSGAIEVGKPEIARAYRGVNSPFKAVTLEENIKALIAENPFHPYNLAPEPTKTLINALDTLIVSAPSLKYQPLAAHSQNLTLASETGEIREVASAPFWSLEGNFSALNSGEIAVVGFENTRYNKPDFIAALLQKRLSTNGGLKFKPLLLKNIFRRFSDYGSHPEKLARHLDGNPATLSDLSGEMNNIKGVKLWLFPPVLGVENCAAIFKKLREEHKTAIAELLPSQNMTAAQRVLYALKTAIRERGISHIPLKTQSVEIKNNLAVGVETSDGWIKAGRVILAAGKFVGGGIESGETPIEPLFKLPLFFVDKTPLGYELKEINAPLYKLCGEVSHYREFNPALTAGVLCDPNMNPLNFERKPIYKNLFVAGSIIAGCGGVGHGGGLGVSLLTGYLAGKKATE